MAVDGGYQQRRADTGQHEAKSDERDACDGKAMVFVHVLSLWGV